MRNTRIVLVLACLALAAPAAADASFTQFQLFASTQIEVTGLQDDALQGQLASRSPRCLRNRVVRVTAADGSLVARTTTAGDGSFSFALPPGRTEDDSYRIRVPLKLSLPICRGTTADVGFDYATLSGGVHGNAFGGVLFSSVPACEPGRIITLYEVSADPEPVGWDAADDNGAWEIGAAGGYYEARADQTVVRDGSRYVVCSAAASFPWYYEEPPEPEPEPEPEF